MPTVEILVNLGLTLILSINLGMLGYIIASLRKIENQATKLVSQITAVAEKVLNKLEHDSSHSRRDHSDLEVRLDKLEQILASEHKQ